MGKPARLKRDRETRFMLTVLMLDAQRIDQRETLVNRLPWFTRCDAVHATPNQSVPFSEMLRAN
jgi:hypothetical protein